MMLSASKQVLGCGPQYQASLIRIDTLNRMIKKDKNRFGKGPLPTVVATLSGKPGSQSQFTYICARLSLPLNVKSNSSWCCQSLSSTLVGGGGGGEAQLQVFQQM